MRESKVDAKALLIRIFVCWLCVLVLISLPASVSVGEEGTATLDNGRLLNHDYIEDTPNNQGTFDVVGWVSDGFIGLDDEVTIRFTITNEQSYTLQSGSLANVLLTAHCDYPTSVRITPVSPSGGWQQSGGQSSDEPSTLAWWSFPAMSPDETDIYEARVSTENYPDTPNTFEALSIQISITYMNQNGTLEEASYWHQLVTIEPDTIDSDTTIIDGETKVYINWPVIIGGIIIVVALITGIVYWNKKKTGQNPPPPNQ